MRVVVVGAGAIGCAIAFALADRGVAVLVMEQATVGSGASGAAAGMLAPFSEAPQPGPLFQAGAEALSEFADWRVAIEAVAGIELEASSGGSLLLADDAEQAAMFRARLAWQLAIDPSTRWIDEPGLTTQAPHLRSGILGALHYPREMQVNAAGYTKILAAAAVARGARIKEWTPVRSLLFKGDRVMGVEADAERVGADAVVLAPGSDVELLQHAGLSLPLGPVKGELVRLTPAARLPSFILRAPGGYLAPTADGSVIVGASELVGRD
ncbi:MAG: NAD(P)/FAD-dependent oxidoreductase, partial [Candidatus Dormibacteraceae bacterium]